MASVTHDTLRHITEAVLRKFREKGYTPPVSTAFEEYHGFLFVNVPRALLQDVLRPFHCTPEDVEVEIIHVDRDLTQEVHFHEHSTAYVAILGTSEGFSEPQNTIAFKDGVWGDVRRGDAWLIPSKTLHGFSVRPGGDLFFLSVQHPPIITGNVGDFHL